ncbi:fatty acid synthase-like [Uranotaenia lowii]|uniref:fatty acid synthase-like n=1 Tax=Uranotaenia lowii TaxID=190385 RepID=UPI0024793F34|nr:fatty acid synthase-like [Uranotaenia lowii]
MSCSSNGRVVEPISSDRSVVISGMAGKFPQSDNVSEFARNLYGKRDLVDDRELRWRHTKADMPRRTGKVNNLDKFDSGFFGIGRRQQDTMDPQQRVLLEHAYEAILDAGVNPESIRGSRTGVFCGVCFSESEVRMVFDTCPPEGLGMLGCAKSQLANRLAYTLDLKGPNFVIDTACSSSMYAFDIAYKNIKNGICDSALVLGSNLTLHPYITYQFALLGVLAKNGYCRPFDKDASGYSRSEAICAVFLQKAKDAKRVYCQVVHTKTNCDGFKPEGITFPSGAVQQQLLDDFYQEIGINPTEVNYVEAHSTGTFVGDPEECAAIDRVYCKDRQGSLLVGSVKSSIGHTEAAAGVCSIAKCIIAMENGLIPPNINFTENKPTISSLVEGRLKVVSESTPLDGSLVAINSFGFGGANAHSLLRRNLKQKRNYGLPEDDLPRLVVWSGRTREAVNVMLQDIAKHPLDAEFIALLCNIQQQEIPGHRYRGFGIYSKNGDKPALLRNHAVDRIKLENLPVVAIFGGVNVHWRQDLDNLRQFPQVESTFIKCNQFLQSFKFDLLIKPSDQDCILYSMVGTTVLQLVIVNLLQSIGVELDFYAGHSIGQFTCAYLDHCLSLEQALKFALWHGCLYSQCKVESHVSAFVKLNQCLNPLIAENLFTNDENSFGVISGTETNIVEQIRQLRCTGFLTEELPFTSLHCSTENEAFNNKLRQIVKSVTSTAIQPTSRWLTSTLPETVSIFETFNMHNTKSILNLLNNVPKHTTVLEFDGPLSSENALAIMNLKSAYLPSGSDDADVVQRLLTKIGHLQTSSQNLQISKLYPEVRFPVSRGTRMIAPLIGWDHRESAFVANFGWAGTVSSTGSQSYKISLSEQEFKFVAGHCIDGRVLFPATGYLHLVWDFLASVTHTVLKDCPIEFEDVQFLRATSVGKGQIVMLTVAMQEVSGYFEILEGETVVVTGYARSVAEDYCIPQMVEQSSSSVTVYARDFYKELRLRGYHYTDLFKSVLETRVDGTVAKVQWKNNWVAFLDCLLQIGIISNDTRSLMVPTAIEKVTIVPQAHLAALEVDGDGQEYFTARSCPRTNVMICGGVVISNPQVNVITRRNPPGVPVLETYNFVPYHSNATVSSTEAIRMCVQLALENIPNKVVSAVELHSKKMAPIVQLFDDAVADLPLVQSSLTLISTEDVKLSNVAVKNEKLSDSSNILFVITDDKLTNLSFMQQVSSVLVPGGFILLRESADYDPKTFNPPENFNHIATLNLDQNETLLLLQRRTKSLCEVPTAICVDQQNFDWLEELQQASKNGPVVLYAEHQPTSGIIGLVNCIRKEPKLHHIRCFLIDDPIAPPFSMDEPFYKKQLNLGLAINIFRNGVWGSYRHALLPKTVETKSVPNHCYANCQTKGDLSSMMWFTGSLNEVSDIPNKARVMYSSLNFRDVMIATGRLASNIMALNRLQEECQLGYEFSGITEDGRRVMGAMGSGALGTMVSYDPGLTWDVPDNWSLEEAATIPIVYGTVCMAYYLYAKVRKGRTILIHSGCGGVGLAAIQMAFANGLKVFTTVSTEEKREYLLNLFPQLKARNIGNSRDTSFEQMVKTRTNGKGVDYVLNSLSEEKLQASLRCLAPGGHFLEIGKYDMSKNSKLAMEIFRKGITFTSVMLDALFTDSWERKKVLKDALDEALATGMIKPLKTTVFEANELEKAIRYLASGKHIGKVLLKIRAEEGSEATLPISYTPRVHCNPEQVYVIVGGLGGFGLELADWLVLRGCRKLLLSSSRGISNRYQEYRIELWQNYGVQVHVSTANISTFNGCSDLLSEAGQHGPVAAIFNLAVHLSDSILENQTKEKFSNCLAPKADATAYLDEASRRLCPELKHFVVFSSVSCGRGNAGQSNYGMANSVMERIIERRHAEGLPGKAIQWGAIGDVGLVADMAEDKIDMEIGGTLQQRITSCLQELDQLLTCDHPVVASMVVAEKRLGSNFNLIEAVMSIMNIRELKSISMESTLADIGMDSLMAVEIKQVLERDFDLVLSPQELRTLTFSKLNTLVEAKEQESSAEPTNTDNVETTQVGAQLLLRNLGNEITSNNTILRLRSANDTGRPILIIPGMEGVAGNVWNTIAENVKAPVYLLQLMNTIECDTLKEIVDRVFDELYETVLCEYDNYTIVAYSFGSIIAMEISKRLYAKGMYGRLLLLDGAPKFLQMMAQKSLSGNTTDENIQNVLMVNMINVVFPTLTMEQITPILRGTSFEDRLRKLTELFKQQSKYSSEYIAKMTEALFKRVKLATLMDVTDFKGLNVPITLVRPSEKSVTDIEDDYGLSECTVDEVFLRFIEGSHMTMLENELLVHFINEFCS